MSSTRIWLLMAIVVGWQAPAGRLPGAEPPATKAVPASDRIEEDADSPFFVLPEGPAEDPLVVPTAPVNGGNSSKTPPYFSEDVEYFPAPQAMRAPARSPAPQPRQASREPRHNPKAQVFAAEWETLLDGEENNSLYEPSMSTSPAPKQSAGGRWIWLPDPREVRDNGFFSDRRAEEEQRLRDDSYSGLRIPKMEVEPSGDREVRELDSLQAPAPPRQRPTARGRWAWLPAPSNIRGNGFFSLDVADAPCEIGPCESDFCEFESCEPGACEGVRPHGFDGSEEEFSLRADCPGCQHARGEQTAEPLPPVPGPSGAEEIADLMARRPSVTEGSVFDDGVDCPGHGRPAAQHRRQAALAQLRQIEAERTYDPEDHSGWDEPHPLTPTATEQRVADSIRTMRETSFDLDVAAQRLEEQQLYYRADQLREFASQLRQEARSALGGWSLKRLYPHTESPVGAERDLGLELEQLRDELLRVRESLKQQAGPAPRR